MLWKNAKSLKQLKKKAKNAQKLQKNAQKSEKMLKNAQKCIKCTKCAQKYEKMLKTQKVWSKLAQKNTNHSSTTYLAHLVRVTTQIWASGSPALNWHNILKNLISPPERSFFEFLSFLLAVFSTDFIPFMHASKRNYAQISIWSFNIGKYFSKPNVRAILIFWKTLISYENRVGFR